MACRLRLADEQRIGAPAELARAGVERAEIGIGIGDVIDADRAAVIGIFATKGSQFGQNQDDIAMVPVTRFLNDFGSERVTINIATQAPSQLVYNETIEKAITAMRIVRGLKPENENDFELYSNDSLISAFAKIADVIAAGSFVISGIALLAAGVGIMNIMLVSVTERTKEIGIRKSIGARKKNILSQFLIEAVAISLAGGVTPLPLPGQTGAEISGKNPNYSKVTIFQDAAHPASLTIPIIGTGSLVASAAP